MDQANPDADKNFNKETSFRLENLINNRQTQDTFHHQALTVIIQLVLSTRSNTAVVGGYNVVKTI